jgi:hypothetical protein
MTYLYGRDDNLNILAKVAVQSWRPQLLQHQDHETPEAHPLKPLFDPVERSEPAYRNGVQSFAKLERRITICAGNNDFL